MRILDTPERHEKGTSKMSMSTTTSKRASAPLLKKDPLIKLKLIGYWVVTAVFAVQMLVDGIAELTAHKASNDIIQIRVHEGYPAYVLTIMGVWKLLGVIALLVPRFPRLKEWAYAGFFFDLTGAAISGIASGGAGDPGTAILLPIILTLIALASWALRPSSRILGVLFPRRQPA
jgi:uncharacterized membrane protein YphA (DoxX/SURF4 family)